MRRSINEIQECKALDWLDDQLDRTIDTACEIVFARQGNLGSQCTILDLVHEARVRGARLSACAELLDIHPKTLQRWKRIRHKVLYKVSRFQTELGSVPKWKRK